ncbi:MAG: ATP-binding protein [Lachnospira eligens]
MQLNILTGTEIIVNVTLKDNNVIIEFKDNGKGFTIIILFTDRNKNSGFGLTMLKERVALLNGNIKIYI